MNKYIFVLIIVFVSLVNSKQIAIDYSKDSITSQIDKYLHGIHNSFYVDIGAYDPIYLSKTNHLFGWNGINVEANLLRHRLFITARTNQINLNVAITDRTGGTAKLVWHDQSDAEASVNPNAITNNRKLQKKEREQNVYQMTLSDLCNNYYSQRPKFMSFSVSGHAYVALNSNDWNNNQCLPELLAVQILKDAQEQQKLANLLSKNSYVLKKTTTSAKIYVHKTVESIYEQNYKRGQKAEQNKRRVYWLDIISQISKSISPNSPLEQVTFTRFDNSRLPFYIHFASKKIIDIERIKDQSHLVSNKPDRPILLLHYNPLISKLYLGSIDFTQKDITAGNEKLTLLTIKYDQVKLEVYVLNYQVEAPQNLAILQRQMSPPKQKPNCEKTQTKIQQKVVNIDDYAHFK